MHDQRGLKLGYIWLQPGVTRLNGWTLLYVLFISIGLLVFLNFQQPYVLEVMLGIPEAEHGRVIAKMGLVHEIVLISLVGPFGALSDRIGRRPVLATGYLFITAGYLAYPFATSVIELTAYRAIFAIGAAAIISTFTTVLTDYPQDISRGKLVALGSILNGLGLSILAGVGGQVISVLTESGYDPVVAGQMAITGVGMIGLLSAVLVFFGLRGETLKLEHEKIPLATLLKEGFGAARNPRIALAYGSAFIARGDNVVVGAYLSLWVQQAGLAANMSAGDAQAKAGILIPIIMAAPLPIAAFFGYINDKIDRVTGLIIASALGSIGYLGFGSMESPLLGMAIPIGIILGCGMITSVISGQTLIGQEADPRITGSTLGAFNFFGSVGTLVSTVLGGYLFDIWTEGGPFLMMGIGSILVLLSAIYVRLRYGASETDEAPI
ncbi:MAG: MFS transporter [Gammaproteobacteria bacterium]|nr:MFS transporter [Gammaproteobacteria bacterium]MCP4277685.1 MFS transporter [Gammaproteobacteria bacterium]MCP4833097.1 MFS transporter [Gammaproteobacteria bacterium]MCP4928882.1 MFS transporter [Gammaproteobacteria bacterium]